MFGKKKKEGKEQETPVQSAPAPVPASAPAAEPAPVPVKKESRREKRKREKEAAMLREEEVKLREAEKRRIEAEVRKAAEKKYNRPRFADFFAFTILVLASVLLLLGPVLKLILQQTGGAEAMTTVSAVAQYCLLAAIAIPAWCFVYRKKLVWKIVFFVALAVFIGGSILGLTL